MSCANRSLQPAEIDASDICAQCKMAISEKRYAAELADAEGNIMKFDNVDCMARYAAAHNLQSRATAWWVVDSQGNEWLDLRHATLVRSASIPGPMGSGVLAAKDEASAQTIVQRFSGKIIHFEDLWKTEQERP